LGLQESVLDEVAVAEVEVQLVPQLKDSLLQLQLV